MITAAVGSIIQRWSGWIAGTLVVATAGCAHTPGPTQGPPAAVAPPTAPTGPAVDAQEVLARVNGNVITVRDMQDRLDKQSALIRARYISRDKQREFLNSLIRFEVLAAEAERLGYERDPEVVRVMKQQMIAKYLRKDFEAKLKIEDLSPADVEAYYKDNRAEFGQRSLDDVRREIRQRLFRERRTKALDALVDSLWTKSQIEVVEGNLAKIVIDTGGGDPAPPAVPAPNGAPGVRDPR